MKLLDFTTLNNIELMDKFHLGLMSQVYDKVLTETFSSKVKKVLEIGIMDGRSIKLWRDYFTKADIYAIDINYCQSLDNEPRITQIVDNAYSSTVIEKIGDNFDFIIDDGPHTVESQLYFLKHYPKLVNPGGILVLEDILHLPPIQEYIDIATKYGNVTLVDLEDHLSDRHAQKIGKKWDCWKALILERE